MNKTSNYLHKVLLFPGNNSADNASLDVDDGSGMRTSKSDTSLADSFVVIPETRKRHVNPMNSLRRGIYLKKNGNLKNQ